MLIDGKSLALNDVVRVARQRPHSDNCETLALSAEAQRKLLVARDYVETNWLRPDSEAIYGFNTGVGRLKNWRVATDRFREFQGLLVNAHSAGTGDPFPEDVVRAAMLLRINANAQGHSGVRVEVLDRLIAMLMTGIHPVIPQKGSVGASGDLAPLAYLAGALMGHPKAEVFYRGAITSAATALADAGLPTRFELEAKEALALLNGSTISLAVAVLALNDAQRCLQTADLALAMNMEAMRAGLAPFDERLHAARPHPGQAATARNVRSLLHGSERCCEAAQAISLPDEARVGTHAARVQDAYSLRCAPQVHGPVRDALEYVGRVLAIEVNSATDNPLMFSREDDSTSFDVVAGGNFHGQYVAQVTDLVALVMTDLGSISERRASRLLDPATSYGLPVNLVSHEPGLNTGFAIAQCTMAALVSENKTLCWPASADSIPTKGNQEDHVSNSTWCSRKAALVVNNVYDILSIELLMATQAISLTEPTLGHLRMGLGTSAVYLAIRAELPAMLEGDRWLHDDIKSVSRLVRSGLALAAAHTACSSGFGDNP